MLTTLFKNKLFHHYFFSYFLILSGSTLIILGFGSTILSELKYYKDQLLNKEYVLEEAHKVNLSEKPKEGVFSSLIGLQQVDIKPVNKSFSIIIEDIGVNAPIIKNVSVTDESEYFEALKKGVAHAKGKSVPGENGNIFLFAHSSIEFWKMGPYATVFNQLRRLNKQDMIYIFYNQKLYKYKIFNKKVVSGFDTTPYEEEYNDRSVLTLQTCDPPGTTLNRLIVQAVEVE